MDLQNQEVLRRGSPPRPRLRAMPGMMAFGVRLAAVGPGARIGRIVAAFTAACFVLAALAMSRKGLPETALVTRAAWSFTWGAGVLLVYGGAVRAFTRDSESGVLFRARASGVTLREYLLGRAFGLMITTGAVLVASELAVLLASFAFARSAPSGPVLRSALAAIVYVLLFTVTLVTVAMPVLANRTRRAGYMMFLGVLLLPQLVTHWSLRSVPGRWRSVLSIPDALEAVRHGVATGSPGEVARALCVLSLVVLVFGTLLLSRGREVQPGGA